MGLQRWVIQALGPRSNANTLLAPSTPSPVCSEKGFLPIGIRGKGEAVLQFVHGSKASGTWLCFAGRLGSLFTSGCSGCNPATNSSCRAESTRPGKVLREKRMHLQAPLLSRHCSPLRGTRGSRSWGVRSLAPTRARGGRGFLMTWPSETARPGQDGPSESLTPSLWPPRTRGLTRPPCCSQSSFLSDTHGEQVLLL